MMEDKGVVRTSSVYGNVWSTLATLNRKLERRMRKEINGRNISKERRING